MEKNFLDCWERVIIGELEGMIVYLEVEGMFLEILERR